MKKNWVAGKERGKSGGLTVRNGVGEKKLGRQASGYKRGEKKKREKKEFKKKLKKRN